MSKVAVTGNSSGTGVFTIAAPNSNTDRTLTLPDEEGTVATIENIPPGYEDQDALDLFNVTGSAPVYACRAWVNFDGTGTVSIRESGNVSSVTDNGTGQYTVNFTTAMPDSNYSVVAMHSLIQSGETGAAVQDANNNGAINSGAIGIGTVSGNGRVDPDHVFVTIFR